MTPEQFCYWLQGRAELDPKPPSPEQWKSICEHLQTVFKKETPPLEKALKGARFIPHDIGGEPRIC